MVVKSDFSLKVLKKEVVTASTPVHDHRLPPSNLDLLLPPIDFTVYFFYKETMGFSSTIGVLKKALAKVLVFYYPFAGEIVLNSVNEPELLCNNRGVDFVEAYADVELHHIDLYNDLEDTIEKKLALQKKNGVLSIQVTELKCGGLVVAGTFDHRISDGYSANMFLVSWAQMALSNSLPILPSFRRSLLTHRCPLQKHPFLDQTYTLISDVPPPRKPLPSDEDHLMSRMYHVSAEKIRELQKLASPKDQGLDRTKLESFSAFLWKLLASYAVKKDATAVLMGVVVDGRKKLSGEMETYFGNVLSIPYGAIKAKQLMEEPLSLVAAQVHEIIQSGATAEHFLELIDWVEARRPVPAMARIYATGSEEGPAFVVSSGQRFPVTKVDFGWGPPMFGSYYFPVGKYGAGYVMPMPCGGDWAVYVNLMKQQLEVIEAEAGDVFRPLTLTSHT